MSLNDVLQKALKLYKIKHLKQQCFVFIHCWLVLKDISYCLEMLGKLRQHASRMAITIAASQRRLIVPLLPRHHTLTSTSLKLEFGDEDNDVCVKEAT